MISSVARALFVCALLWLAGNGWPVSVLAAPSGASSPVIVPVPLPNDALPPESRLKEFPKAEMEAEIAAQAGAPTAPAGANIGKSIAGFLVTSFVLGTLGMLLAGIIVYALARQVLRRTIGGVAHAATSLLFRTPKFSEHGAETLAAEAEAKAEPEAAGEIAAEPSHERSSASRFRPPPPLTDDETTFMARLVAAVPQWSVMPKLSLSSLLTHDASPEWQAVWNGLGRTPLDFVVARSDDVVVAVIKLDSPESADSKTDAVIAAALDGAGYRLLRWSVTDMPEVPALRAALLNIAPSDDNDDLPIAKGAENAASALPETSVASCSAAIITATGYNAPRTSSQP